MKIGDKDYTEIIVTDAETNLLASITDKDIGEEKNCMLVCVPAENLPRLLFFDVSGWETGLATLLMFLT